MGGTGGGIFAKNFAPACKHGKPPVLLPYQAIDLEFPEPAEGVFGFGNSLDYETALEESDSETALKAMQVVDDHYDFTVTDTVKVPKKKGRYVLSWRWDSERTPQVWANCALVDIVEKAGASPLRSGASRAFNTDGHLGDSTPSKDVSTGPMVASIVAAVSVVLAAAGLVMKKRSTLDGASVTTVPNVSHL